MPNQRGAFLRALVERIVVSAQQFLDQLSAPLLA